MNCILKDTVMKIKEKPLIREMITVHIPDRIIQAKQELL